MLVFAPRPRYTGDHSLGGRKRRERNDEVPNEESGNADFEMRHRFRLLSVSLGLIAAILSCEWSCARVWCRSWKKKADCHCDSHVCDLWKKEEILKKKKQQQHLVSCQGAQSAPISKACAVILRLSSKIIYISPTQTLCCSKVIHFASCVLLHFYSLSLFFCSPHASIFGSPTD